MTLPSPRGRFSGNDGRAAAEPVRMRPQEIVKAWVEAFNRADVEALANFYSEAAINHQVAEEPVEGRQAIREMFRAGFAAANMVCIPEHIFEDGEWAILEWRDPAKRLRVAAVSFTSLTDARSCFNADTGTS